MFYYFIIYKPYQTLSQFSKVINKQTLSDVFTVPNDVYPVGRLDEDSEGLLILTNDKKLNHRLLNPQFKHEREYWVQVEGEFNEEAKKLMQQGLQLSDNKSVYTTKPCKVEIFKEQPLVAERNPPIRYRAAIPTSWIRIILTEGRNRQVRKMTAKVGFPTLRLIRHRIENISLNDMQPGDIISLPQKTIYKKLFAEG